MSLWQRLTGSFRKKEDKASLRTGRSTQAAVRMPGTLSPHRSRTFNVLSTLRRIPREADALLFLRKVNADISMAVWNFMRLANLGHEMHFYSPVSGERMGDVEGEWRDFASRVNTLSNSGLDGLLDQLHFSAFLLSGQGVEVEVSRDRKDIVDIYPINPLSLEWELEEHKGRKVWVPYQVQDFKRVSLADANFFWVPTDPDIDDPRGNYILSSAIQAVDFQMQILQDLQQVIHNQGYPRYDFSLDLERLMAHAPASVRNDSAKLKEYVEGRIEGLKSHLRSLAPDDSFVHTDDIEAKMLDGANQGRSLDVRAVTEMIDQFVMSGAKQLSVFMNRNTGVTETWGTVQFRIFAAGIESIQRGSKRLIESVARLWLQVKGIQATPKFSHNTIDWHSEEQRWEVKLMQQQFWAIAQLMGWVDGDTASQETTDMEGAVGEPIENIRAGFSMQSLGGDVLEAPNLRQHDSRSLGGYDTDTVIELEKALRNGITGI